MKGNTIFDLPPSIGKYKFVRVIGSGAHSIVTLAVNTEDNIKYAIKILSKAFLLDTQSVERFTREVTLISKIKHQNIVEFVEMLSDDNLIYLVMEYCSRGDLFKFMNEHSPLNETSARVIFQQIISGIDFLHTLGIVHRDIKPENILIDEALNVKICDFGFSRETVDNMLLNTRCGSPIYISPEILAGRQYDGKMSDMWALGVLLYVLTVGNIPWENINNETQLFYQIQTARYHIPETLSPGLQNIINGLMQPQPTLRFTCKEAMNHPWTRDNTKKYRSSSGCLNQTKPKQSKLANYASSNISQFHANSLKEHQIIIRKGC